MSSKKHEHAYSSEIVGRLGRDPEQKQTPKGQPYVKLSIATSESGPHGERTEWHNATAWGEKAKEIAEKGFKKGDSIALSGDLRINTYEKDGKKNRVTEITVNEARKNLDGAPSKNETRLVGVVHDDPKGREVKDGKQMTTLSVATKTVVNGREREDWHSVTAWADTAVAAREIKKGDTIEVAGALRHRSFAGEDGIKRKLSSIECQRFQVLERAQELAVAPQVRRGRKGVEQGM